MKKTIAIIGAGLILAATTMPALAGRDRGGRGDHNDRGGIQVDVAWTETGITAMSNTGDNYVEGNTVTVRRSHVDGVEAKGDNSLWTGRANTRVNNLTVANVGPACTDCDEDVMLDANVAVTRTGITAMSNTGGNDVFANAVTVEGSHADDVEAEGDNCVMTGEANTSVNNMTVVNASWETSRRGHHR
jgi:hypothetical protein